MESNRNLSSVIQRIRDDGPPESGSAPPDHAYDASPDIRSGAARTGRRVRLAVLWLTSCLILVAAVFWLLQMYGVTKVPAWRDLRQHLTAAGSFPAPAVSAPGSTAAPGVAAAVPPAPSAPSDERLEHLQVRLNALGTRLEQAAAAQEARARELDRILGSMADSQHAQVQQLTDRIDALEHRVDTLAKARKARAAHPTSAGPARAKPASRRTADQPVAATAAHAKPSTPPAADQAVVATAAHAKPSTPPSADQAVVAAPAHAKPSSPPAADQPAQAGTEPPAQPEWVVNVASSTELARIRAAEQHMRKLGISVERQQVEFGGEMRYRLRVTGFHSIADARTYARKLQKDMGIQGAWASLR
jgi:hypothetical protein